MNAITTQPRVTWMPYLRPSPLVAEAALRVLSIGELDAATLALVIGSDPGLAAAVIRATEPADIHTSITERITGLSPSRLQSALFPALIDAFTDRAAPLSAPVHDSWRNAMATALAAEAIARESGEASPDAGYLSGLLHGTAERLEGGGPDGQNLRSFRGIGRRYRFPEWLLECLESQDDPIPNRSLQGVSALVRILKLAKIVAAQLTGTEPSEEAALANAAKRLQFDGAALQAARRQAAQSYARRLSLFEFSPAPVAELQASLLRFSNHLMLYWRVDESSSSASRTRADHLDALLRFETATANGSAVDELLHHCAGGLRASLTVDVGLIVAWLDDDAPLDGIRWNKAAGMVEPLRIGGDGAPADRTVQRILADDIWPANTAKFSAPCILPVRTPTRRHAGYVVLAAPPAQHADWLEYANEWSAALGRAIDRAQSAARDDAYRDALRQSWHEQHPRPVETPDTSDLAVLRQRNIARATMAALHAPLSIVTTQAHQIVSQATDAGTHKLVEEIARQARNAARVMADLRTIACGGESPNEFILINAPLRQFLSATRPRLERRSIELTEHLSDGLPRIRADVRKLNHLFTNLFAFIEQRMGNSGRTITVTSEHSEDRESVCVRINVVGLAITQDQTDGLFDPFDSHERAGNEFALALAACGHIVKEIGGSIHAASTTDGAVFTIDFSAIHAVLAVERAPAAEEAESSTVFEAVPPPEMEEPTRNGPRVLIVDDDDVMRDLMKQALLRRKYRVDVAKDGNDAIRAIDTYSVDVLLLDLLMPNRDGFAVLRNLAQRKGAPPTIVMTGSRAADTRDEAMELGARAFLQKPFELGQLLAEVESVLAGQRV